MYLSDYAIQKGIWGRCLVGFALVNTIKTCTQCVCFLLCLAPTVLRDVKPEAKVMQEEIFGPLLPILSASSLDEAIKFINKREKPLALYVFTQDDKVPITDTLVPSVGVAFITCSHHQGVMRESSSHPFLFTYLQPQHVQHVDWDFYCRTVELLGITWIHFGFSVKVIKKMTDETSSGGLLANDCLVHYSVSSLPFGGVGEKTQGYFTGEMMPCMFFYSHSCLRSVVQKKNLLKCLLGNTNSVLGLIAQ